MHFVLNALLLSKLPALNIGGCPPILNGTKSGCHSVGNYSAWLKLGGRGLDTALAYTDPIQRLVGEAVAGSGLPRGEIFVTTKMPCCPSFFPQWDFFCGKDGPPRNTTADVLRSLRLLGLDYADAVLLHWPCRTQAGTLEAYRALEALHDRGLIKQLGTSNFNATFVDALWAEARVKPSVNQCPFSIGNHAGKPPRIGNDYTTARRTQQLGMSFAAYAPLGGTSGVPVLSNPEVKAIAAVHNVSTAQVALRWLVQQDIDVVTASANADHLADDMGVFDFSLSEAEVAALRAI